MAWQYYFPVGLALISFFPTDALTRTVGIVARLAGALALLLATLSAGIWAARLPLVWSGVKMFGEDFLFGFGAAVLASEWFRAGLLQLQGKRQQPMWPLLKMKRGARRVVLGISWMLLMLLIGGLAYRNVALACLTRSICAILLGLCCMRYGQTLRFKSR
jgi:hypothetical protein